METIKNTTNASFDQLNLLKHQKQLEELNNAEVKRLIPTIAFLLVISVAGSIGNSIIFHVYRTSYKTATSAKCFILCLSLIDLLTCCFAIPLEIVTIFDQFTFEYVWLCKISRVFNTLGTNSSAYLLLFIAVDRFRKVCRPFGWQIGTFGAKCLIGLAVLLGMVHSCPALFIYGKHSFVVPEINVTASECSTTDELASINIPFYYALSYGIMVVGGIMSLWILYCLIGLKIRKQTSKMNAVLGRNAAIAETPSRLHLDITDTMSYCDNSDIRKRDEKNILKLNKKGMRNKVMRIKSITKITNTFESDDTKKSPQFLRKQAQARKTTSLTFILTLAFVISSMPHHLLMLTRQMNENFVNELSDTNKAVYKFFLRSYFFNSAVNPIIYSIFGSKFQSACKESFNCCFRT